MTRVLRRVLLALVVTALADSAAGPFHDGLAAGAAATAPPPSIVLNVAMPHLRYTVRLGGVVYVFEPGMALPGIIPRVQRRYLRLTSTRQYGACPANASCAFSQGFVWRYLAIRAGRTVIVLEPQCRRSTPQCMIAERAVTVRIVPLPTG